MGGYSYHFPTATYDPSSIKTRNLGSSLPLQFDYRFYDYSSSEVKVIQFLPRIISETRGQAYCGTLWSYDTQCFTFSGTAGERITVRLWANDEGTHQGSCAGLTLAGWLLLKTDMSQLPNQVSGILRKTGTFSVKVSNFFMPTWGKFIGDFCIDVSRE